MTWSLLGLVRQDLLNSRQDFLSTPSCILLTVERSFTCTIHALVCEELTVSIDKSLVISSQNSRCVIIVHFGGGPKTHNVDYAWFPGS